MCCRRTLWTVVSGVRMGLSAVDSWTWGRLSLLLLCRAFPPSLPALILHHRPRHRQAGAGLSAPPRCGAHRDFGPATLIWPGGEGLEVR